MPAQVPHAPPRWIPKTAVVVLDAITPDQHPLFRFILTRNGHNVALYGGRAKADQDCRDRALRFPNDDWSVVERT
jgi:hypothetical protein